MKPTRTNIHAEWLNLLDISGPFLSTAALNECLPDGLDRLEPARVAALRAAFATSRPDGRQEPDAGAARNFCLHVLTEQLGYDPSALADLSTWEPEAAPRLELPEMGVCLQADYALMQEPAAELDDLATIAAQDREAGAPALLIRICPGEPPDQPLRKSGCPWSPQRRMAELCRACNVPLGLVSDGEQFTLVYAPRNRTPTYATWQASLWLEERITLQAFITLLHKRRFFSVRAEHTLPRLLEKSTDKQQNVTEKLGQQVRGAVTEFIRAIDRIGRSCDPAGADCRQMLAMLPAALLYEAALTVMMRLVFLLAAEERGLLRLGNALWDESYAASTIWQGLRAAADRHGEEELEQRTDAWLRLLALFRGVHGGISHDAIGLPAYGGNLFDPDKYPFLEGREPGSDWRHAPAQPLPINNRVVLRMLESLQFLRDRTLTGSDEAVRLSFRGLDVEQIGHVYEGLLDRTAARVNSVLLGLEGKKEAYIPLEEAERLLLADPERLLKRLNDLSGTSVATLRSRLQGQKSKPDQATLSGGDPDADLLRACENDAALARRILPFAGLLRRDADNLPVVALKGGLYVTPGSQRRDTGTHYTPRHLAETIVAATLEPHVYEGPAEGKPQKQWRLRSAAELLRLKVCDMAMGSGAFLVAACRQLSEKLLEAWEREPEPDLPQVPEEREAFARRRIADNCLYGVDNNPLAVEMARLSLWLVTMRKDRPFTFLDHVLRCGDALLGLTSLKQLEEFSLAPGPKDELVFGWEDMRQTAQATLQKRAAITALASDSILNVERKAALLAQAEKDIASLRLRADALIMATLRCKGILRQAERYNVIDKLLSPKLDENERAEWLEEQRQTLIRGTGTAKTEKDADDNPGYTRPLHWALEFPEVFAGEDPGFDAIIGNPPFLGSQLMRKALGHPYREYLVEAVGQGERGKTDLAAYFFLRAHALARKNGDFGLIATNTIAQGETRKAGLALLEKDGCTIRAAWPDVPWDGNATVTTSQIVLRNSGDWLGGRIQGDQKVQAISSFLQAGKEEWEPARLKENRDLSFQGVIPGNQSFIINEEQARHWIADDPKNARVLAPYLIGDDLTSEPDQKPSRWIISFYDWSEQACAENPVIFTWLRKNITPASAAGQDPAPGWWLFHRPRPKLYHAIGRGDLFKWHPKSWAPFIPYKRVLALSGVTKYCIFSFVPNGYIYDHALYIFATDDSAFFGILQSSLHDAWVRKQSSTLGTDQRYTNKAAFETFPRPQADRLEPLAGPAQALHDLRAKVMAANQIGLTALYNEIHKPESRLAEVGELRQRHEELDRLVVTAYGWTDLDLRHDFHRLAELPKEDNLRHTLAPQTRLEIIRRLTELNRERWLAEQEAEAAAKSRRSSKKGAKKRASGQGALLGKGE